VKYVRGDIKATALAQRGRSFSIETVLISQLLYGVYPGYFLKHLRRHSAVETNLHRMEAVGSCFKFLRGIDGNQSTFIYNGDAVAELIGFIHIMRS